jgi:predicted RNase H-related nuclease YkuK (DUF458 family)
MKQFKTLTNNEDIDLVNYIKNYVKQYPETQILIGCDSQNRVSKKTGRKETTYAVVIGLYNPGKGAHVLYFRNTTPMEKEGTVRLLNEVWFSIETAEHLKNELGIRATWIDIDLNPDPKFKSNQALTSAVGIVTGMGYKVRHKGNSPVMTYAADHLVK